MDGLVFQTTCAPPAINPARADIACFVGFVARRGEVAQRAGERAADWLARTVPAGVRAGLTERGWVGGANQRPLEDLTALLQVPVTIDSWDAFDRLFAWESRPLNATGELCTAALGAAVRSFFTQGGRRCHVVRTGDPLPVDATAAQRRALLSALLAEPRPSPADRGSWRGAAHVYGLPDASFLSLPDLPELFGSDTSARRMPAVPDTEEKFVPLAEDVAEAQPPQPAQATIARCDRSGFVSWAAFVQRIVELVARDAREVQFVAALPLPIDETSLGGDSRSATAAAAIRAARDAQWTAADGLNTAFVQLAYPWLRTSGADSLPGQIEAPDGVLTGLLAHHALARGTWLSALRTPVPDLYSLYPVLDRSTLDRPLDRTAPSALTVRERVSLFAPSPTGMLLLSDVTTQNGSYRPANLNRLLSAIVRAARIVGEESVFENNGETLWARLADRLNALLTELWRLGVFAGESPAEAFEVRCDRSTMTQADLDAGRTIVRLAFTAAAPIERLIVLLAMDDGGQVSLLSPVGMDTEDL
jgi:hypothetical protein